MKDSTLPKDRAGRFTVTLHLPSSEQVTASGKVPVAAMEEAENLPRMQEDEVIPLLPSTYYPTLWIGGQELAARTAWYLIWEQARPRYPEAIAQHFLQVTPLWQVTPTPDGDVVYALYLGISSGMVNRLQGALAPLETAVKTQYPQQSFSLVVGPLLEEEESNTPR